MAKRGSDSDYIIREAKVLSVDDKYRGGRIKVRLGGIDANIANDIDLPYCFPLLPKIIHVRPKVGEAVLVILGKNNSGKSNRYYIGPVLSQDYFYLQEMYDISALNMLINRKTKPQQNPDNDQLNKGTLPEPDDIAITGRENTDIILKNNELRLSHSMTDITTDTGKCIGKSFALAGEDYTDDDFNDICISISSWNRTY